MRAIVILCATMDEKELRPSDIICVSGLPRGDAIKALQSLQKKAMARQEASTVPDTAVGALARTLFCELLLNETS